MFRMNAIFISLNESNDETGSSSWVQAGTSRKVEGSWQEALLVKSKFSNRAKFSNAPMRSVKRKRMHLRTLKKRGVLTSISTVAVIEFCKFCRSDPEAVLEFCSFCWSDPFGELLRCCEGTRKYDRNRAIGAFQELVLIGSGVD